MIARYVTHTFLMNFNQIKVFVMDK